MESHFPVIVCFHLSSFLQDHQKKTKKGYPPSEYPFFLFYVNGTYASATTSFTETKERFSLPLRKVTTPSTNAYNVWSLPIPTFSPG